MNPRLALRDQLASGCTEDEFRAMRCPECGSALTFHVHPRKHVFFLCCSANGGSLHLSIHSGPHGTPPEWWSKYVSGGWY